MSLAATTMGRRFTVPFARGADTLDLELMSGDAHSAGVRPYLRVADGGFSEHRARFDAEPDPRYVLACRHDLEVDTEVTLDWRAANGTQGTTEPVLFPAASRAGASTIVRPPAGAELERLDVSPASPSGQAAADWGLTALLGNLAKLLWATGAERDQIRRQLELVAEQRHSATALGPSLDLLGRDLGVPRFPPLAYGFDPDAVAILHLDDRQARPSGQPDAADALAAYRPRRVVHHAKNVGGAALAGVPGRFGTAFAFRAPSAELRMADHADFAVGAHDSFTVECFVQRDPGASGHVISKQAEPGSPGAPGWALTIGDFGRGIEGNLRWLLADGTPSNAVAVFADEPLDSSHFHHLAGVIDRSAAPLEARLYVDGELRMRLPLGSLGSLTNTADVRVGMHDGAGAMAVVDEVRLSRVARKRFDPVLGESDETYRRRLGIFEHWTLPSPANIEVALNEAVDEIGGVRRPFVVADASAALVTGAAPMRIEPAPIPPGGRIDGLGRRRTTEEEACGGIEDHELNLDTAWLASVEDQRADFDPAPARALAPGEQQADTRLMHAAAAAGLGVLLDGLGPTGRLTVKSAFDPRAGDLRAVGRGLLLAHSGLTPGELARSAHVAGFDFVEHRAQERAAYCSVQSGEHLTVTVASPSSPEPELRVGDVLEVGVAPSLPGDAVVEWSTIQSGAGRLAFDGPSDRPTARLRALAAGEVTVHVYVSRRASSAAGTRTFGVGPGPLSSGETIGLDGRSGVEPSVADGNGPQPFFHPVYLVHSHDERIEYAAGVDTHRTQAGVARLLERLLDRLAAAGSPRLRLLAAYDPTAGGAAARGRRLVIAGDLPPGELAAQAHLAGFAFVACQPDRVEVRHSEEEVLSVSAGSSAPSEGDVVPISVDQRAAPVAVVVGAEAVYVANSGSDSVSELDPQTGAVRRAFKVGHEPVAMATDPSGTKRLYTADRGSGTISVVDLASGDLPAPIDLGQAPSALVHHPTLDRLFVACPGDHSVRAIDATTGATVASATVGSGEVRLALAADRQRLFAVAGSTAEVRVLTLDRLQLSAQLGLAGTPGDIALSQTGPAGWVSLPSAGKVAVIAQGSGSAPTVFKVVSVREPATPTASPTSELAVAPSGSEVYLVDTFQGTRGLVLDATGTVVTQFGVVSAAGRIVAGPAVRPGGRRRSAGAGTGARVYVPTLGNDVAVFEPTEGGLVPVNSWRLGSGLGEEARWIARAAGDARAGFRSMRGPATDLSAELAGPVLASAVWSLGDKAPPYTVEVGLKEGLGPTTVIRKNQYDLIMNVLNLLHPIGVEVDTRAIRSHVIEVREGLLEAFPDYTYPKFRTPGSSAPSKTRE